MSNYGNHCIYHKPSGFHFNLLDLYSIYTNKSTYPKLKSQLTA